MAHASGTNPVVMISFEAKNVEMPKLDFSLVSEWLNQVAASYDKIICNLNYLFCDDKEILRVNRKFLNHDYYTDIITFDYCNKNKVSGDIFISLDTVKDNAKDLGEDAATELLRVISHGLLHLCGIDDKAPGEREIMESQENKALALFNQIRNNK